jgi:hypothetical protein
MRVKALIGAASFISAPAARADPLWCLGSIKRTFLDSSGMLYILPSIAEIFLAICNVSRNYQHVPAEICRGWHADVLAAMLATRTITVYYLKVGGQHERFCMAGAWRLSLIWVTLSVARQPVPSFRCNQMFRS